MNYVEFDATQFFKGSLLVHCPNREDSNDFLDFCNEYGININLNGVRINNELCYQRFKENTLYGYIYTTGELILINFDKNKHYSKICKWQVNKSTEQASTASRSTNDKVVSVFNDIIKSIVPGQQFQNEHHIIVCDQNGIHFHDRCTRGLVNINFNDEFTEVTYAVDFSEAIKQLHQGKTIVSLVSDVQYKIDEQGDLFMLEDNSWIRYSNFNIDDISGKWLVR